MGEGKLIQHESYKNWRVKLSETVGTGNGEVIMEGWIRHIPARDKKDACMKALLFHMRQNPGSRPKIVDVELEPYSRPIII